MSASVTVRRGDSYSSPTAMSSKYRRASAMRALEYHADTTLTPWRGYGPTQISRKNRAGRGRHGGRARGGAERHRATAFSVAYVHDLDARARRAAGRRAEDGKDGRRH